jgi:hypothetical protein
MPVPRLTRRSCLALLPSLAAAGCGYTLAGRGQYLPTYITAISVPAFGNTTPIPRIDQIFTNKVRAEFQNRGQYRVVTGDTGADGLVKGTITGLGALPVAFTASQLARRLRLTVVLAVSFEDLRQKKVLWENPALSFSDEYELASPGSLGGDAGAFIGQETAVIDRLGDDFARNVVTAILEAF